MWGRLLTCARLVIALGGRVAQPGAGCQPAPHRASLSTVPAGMILPEKRIFLNVDLGEPFDVGDSVPAGNEQAERRALVTSKRLAVQGPGQKGLRRHRFFARETATELQLDLIDLPAKLHVLGAVIGAEEDELARLGLHACLLEHRPERDTCPASIAGKTLQWTTIPR